MSDLGVDASAAIKWFLDEEFTPEAMQLLTSALWKTVRRGGLDAAGARAMLGALDDYGIVWHRTDSLAARAVDLAIETGQSVYDCTYLALALREKLEVVTRDDRLLRGLEGTPYRSAVIDLREWAARSRPQA